MITQQRVVGQLEFKLQFVAAMQPKGRTLNLETTTLRKIVEYYPFNSLLVFR